MHTMLALRSHDESCADMAAALAASKLQSRLLKPAVGKLPRG